MNENVEAQKLGCPFCGSPNSLDVREYRFRGFAEYRVVCTPSLCGCGAEGPAASERLQAINQWNQRSVIQPTGGRAMNRIAGNTGIVDPSTGKVTPLVIPDVNDCPACGAQLVTQMDDGGRWAIDAASKPEAIGCQDARGAVTDFVLTWTCARCGLRWTHGQFKEGGQ